jgi:hypothetical protein
VKARLTVNVKKRMERDSIQMLLQQLGIDSVISDCEAPDFICVYGGQCLGIEVTELLRTSYDAGRESDQRAYEAERIMVKKLASQRYLKKGGLPVHVGIKFNEKPITRKDRSIVADWLAELVFANQPSVNEPFSWECERCTYGSYPAQISSVDVYRLDNGVINHWPHNCSAFVTAGAMEAVTASIASKEAKLQEYMHWCEACWLLLVADPVTRGSVSLFDWSECKSLVFKTCFERVFLRDTLEDAITELKVEMP